VSLNNDWHQISKYHVFQKEFTKRGYADFTSEAASRFMLIAAGNYANTLTVSFIL
jgi:hypothetical protein